MTSQKNFADVEYFVLTPSMLGSFVRKANWGIQAYYRKLYGIKIPKTKEMEQGETLHEHYGYTNKQKLVKKFEIEPGVVVELRGIPDRIDSEGRPWEAKTIDGVFVSDDKYEAAKIQLLCYLFMLDSDYGYIDFISRTTGSRLPRFPKIILRNDDYLFDVIRSFVKILRNQKQLEVVS